MDEITAGCACDCLPALKEKIAEGEHLLIRCQRDLNHLSGIHKIMKKVKAELNFLKKLQVSYSPEKCEQVHSSNLGHLAAILDAACTTKDTISVLQPFHLPVQDLTVNRVVVDVVGDGGRMWIKVVARNQHSMNRICQGQGQFGERSIVDRAKIFVACARQNEIFYGQPSVHFFFYNGVTEEVTQKLIDEGVLVKCIQRAEVASPSLQPSVFSVASHLQEPLFRDRSMIFNLDVSTMLAFVSSITNGGAHFEFLEPVLANQAAREKIFPVKLLLDSLFCDRKLISCETAVSDFRSILNKVGGEKEKYRGEILLERLSNIVPDSHSPVLEKLKIGGKIKMRSLIIFGTGQSMKAVTVTANAGFVRAACSQGILFPVYVHESRALGEKKSN